MRSIESRIHTLEERLAILEAVKYIPECEGLRRDKIRGTTEAIERFRKDLAQAQRTLARLRTWREPGWGKIIRDRSCWRADSSRQPTVTHAALSGR